MPRLLKHPRCKDFFRASRNPKNLESVTLTAKNNNLASRNVTKILKSLRKRSFYKAIEIVSDMGNIAERNDILQIFLAGKNVTFYHWKKLPGKILGFCSDGHMYVT